MFTKEIGIDLGTANTLVYMRGKGIIIREPSVVAVDTRTDRAKYVGQEAKDVIGRTPGSIVAVRPLKDGVIADFEITTTMLQEFIKKALKGSLFSKAHVVICIPSGVTAVERRAVKEAAENAGAKKVNIIEEPMAAAIGAGLPVSEPQGSMIVDIGGGTSEVAVISLGGIVTSRSVRCAGDSFDAAIINYIKKKYNLLIGERTAENAGAKKVNIIEEPMAAAIGAGLPVSEPQGSMIVDIGGGTSEVAVISLGGIVTSRSVRCAGDSFDAAIINYIKKKYNLLIGERTAENVKIAIGSAFPMEQETEMEIKGRNLLNGLPENILVTSTEIREALAEPLSNVIEAIKVTLEKTPPELAADIIDQGITLAGGGANIRGLDKLINKETGMPVYVAESPLDCVADGTGKVLEEIEKLREVLNDDSKYY